VAVANAIHHTGATPVFCDVTGERDLNVDPEHITASMTARTKAIVVLHYGGFPCAIDYIAEAARERGVALIEDAAHAIGARHRERACGAIGDLGCFSFFANKNLPVGEGGVVVTDDEDLARRVRLLRSHGMTTLTWDRHQGHASDYDVLAPGFNYRLDEIRAALASVQLDRLAPGNAARGRLWGEYVRLLHGTHGLVFPFADRTDDLTTSAYHLAVAVLAEGTNRDVVRLQLAQDGIQTSVHYPPVHRFSAYAGPASPSLPRTDAIADRLLTLPLYPQLSSESVERVARAVRAALDAPDAAGPRVVSPAEL
jgi:dTDP-4-amino-4,6-dideoxygalactose transaminase